MTAHTTLDEIFEAIDAVDFPAGKETLVETARRAGASGEVVVALQEIPAEQYGSRQDIARSVRLDPDSDMHRTPGEKGAQARQGGKPGLSQHLRDAPKPPVDEELER
ncbi:MULTISPECIES: DUF2795 domain-containing protein [Streptomyces]|uniref:DUF2795 domain-containing protein n=4 Tax=Streptomyces TaxID=1883 RepID=A0A8H9HG80_9ACTN|nr:MULTISPECIES: DUF2795 domain-containing protein [Streptomyces]MBL3803733.1 DUF2795 domain-containing protein [Streptomyces sp. BRB081]MDQ0296314.1 hypothetical protein [Streptomyces sp. DSM 41037]NEC11643.1 DUF2795 domain-containing protein [Streptomyces sp. SID8014]PJM83760.1 hypothetical protein CH313_07085 [Streptomyces sp. TSRI0384-2]QNE83850.1 DUF2795 domain-containing protein [Streptomyces rutgersensis]